MQQFLDQECPQYPMLSVLLGGDSAKVEKVLRAFYRAVWKDLEKLERLASEEQWYPAVNLVSTIGVSCRQIGEDEAAGTFTSLAVAAIEKARTDAAEGPRTFMRLFQSARSDLVDVLDRAAVYVAFAGAER